MLDPHLVPLVIENRAQTKFARLYLAHSEAGEYSLHVHAGEHGMHEDETLNDFLKLSPREHCQLGDDWCFWIALGSKKTFEGAAVINATFERYRKCLDRVLERTWDWRCAMRDIGRPHRLG